MDSSDQPLTPTPADQPLPNGLTPERVLLELKEAILVSRSFSGPMPPPEYLKQYDQIVPGAAREIIDEFKANGAHQRAMDQAILQTTGDRDRRAQWMACSLVFLGFILIMALAWTHHDWVAAAVAGTLLGAVVTGFLKGKKASTAQSSPTDEPPND